MPKARPTVGPRVAVDGLKEYKQAISELNASNKTLSAELKKLQAEYKGNTDSTEFLTKKGEILNDQLLRQKEKVEQLRGAMQQAAAAYGESDTRTQAYAASLANAEAETYNLEHAIEENEKALQNEGQTMTGLGDAAESLADKLGIKIPQGAKEALNGMGSFSAGSVAKLAAISAAAAAVIKVIKDLNDMTLQAAHDVDELITESMVTGVSTKTLQAWQYAENLIDVPVSTMTSSLTKLTKAMGDAENGSTSAIEKFESLGVSIEDSSGHLRNAEDVFYDVIDALGQTENQTERDAAAMELLGKSAQDLNPLIKAGSDALKGFGDEAQAVGYILSEDQVSALAEVDDAYQRMQLTVDATKKQLAADFAPASQEAMELFTKAVKGAADILDRSGIIEHLGSIISSIGKIIESVLDVLGSIPGLRTALEGLNQILAATARVVALIADAADLVSSLLRLDWNGVKNALGFGYSSGNANNYQTVKMQQQGTYGEYKAWNGFNAIGTDNWRGGLTWVGENGPELALLPSGTQVLTAQESRNVTGGDTFYVTIDAKNVKEFNDIVQLAKTARVRERMR